MDFVVVIPFANAYFDVLLLCDRFFFGIEPDFLDLFTVDIVSFTSIQLVCFRFLMSIAFASKFDLFYQHFPLRFHNAPHCASSL